jgi:hypothetical protein
MVYSFARVGATITTKVGDYFQHRKRWWLRLHEKGGKRHEVPYHPSLEAVFLIDSAVTSQLMACTRWLETLRKARHLPENRIIIAYVPAGSDISSSARSAACGMIPPLFSPHICTRG